MTPLILKDAFNCHGKPIAITTGEPAGIGPDIALQIASQAHSPPVVLVGDRSLLSQRAKPLGLSVALDDYSSAKNFLPGHIVVEHVPIQVPCVPGQLNVANAPYVTALLDVAIDGCMSGQFVAMVTAPVHKGIINEANIAFAGHTEYLAKRLNTPCPVMLFVGENFRVALVSTHIPLSSVIQATTKEKLDQVIRVLHTDLVNRFRIASPYIMVAGLNPHAGEGGYLGQEEIDVISPVITALKHEGMHIDGPFSADTLWQRAQLQHADVMLMMYHDQGLPALKLASFGHSVNVTLGLPIIRTSVDHGTALDLAATGKATTTSLLKAVDLAEKLTSSA